MDTLYKLLLGHVLVPLFGIKNFLRLPDDLTLFGDCGAFGYVDQDEPPYDPLETLDFYEQMQYDQACTVDHVITSQDGG